MSTKDNLQREADSASEKLSDAKSEVTNKAYEMAGQAQQAAKGYAEEGKQVAAGHLNDFARAIRSASNELSERDQGVAARFVTEAADGLEKVANSISGRSVDEMMGSVQSFARRNPGAFVIGSVLAGVALGRFAKASSERPQGPGSSLGYETGGGGAPRGQYGATGSSAGTSTGTAAGGSVGPASGTGTSS